jgi:hypothetical protein
LLRFVGEKTTLFMCEHGAHRGAIGAAIFMTATGYPPESAVDQIEQLRYVADMSSSYQAFRSGSSSVSYYCYYYYSL